DLAGDRRRENLRGDDRIAIDHSVQQMDVQVALRGEVVRPEQGGELAGAPPRAEPLIPIINRVLWMLSAEHRRRERFAQIARDGNPRGVSSWARIVVLLEALERKRDRAVGPLNGRAGQRAPFEVACRKLSPCAPGQAVVSRNRK